jgi:transposase
MSLPADTRDYAAIEAYKNFTTNLNSGHGFNMTFKSKHESQSIDIRKRQFNVSNKSKYKFLSEIKRTEDLPELEHDIKIHKDILEDFYILIPVKLNRSESQTPNRIISLDPGIRTFFTGYTHDGYVYHLGENDISRICRLYYYKFKLQRKMDLCKNNQRKLLYKKAISRLSRKQRDLVDEAHKKISKWLLENFDFIIIPKLDTNSFCRKQMSKKVKNKIKAWRHCSFLDRLKFKNLEYPNVYITSPTEEYTSKTCSNCGFIHEQLGSSKTFNCPKCVKSFDRDVNAAKNILLKCISKEVLVC